MAAIPALLAVSALQTYTTRKCLRTQLSLILESAEPRETHHFALLLSCGVTAVNPYMIYELLRSRGMGDEEIAHYNKAGVKGVIKILSKMGISTVQSFRGSHVFEAVGLSRELIDEFFPGTVSRVGGLGLDGVARERAEIHEKAFVNSDGQLESGGVYQYRADGEYHLFNPETIHLLQKACREGDYKLFKEYSAHLNEETRKSTLRSIMKIRPGVRRHIDKRGRERGQHMPPLQDRRDELRLHIQGGARVSRDSDEPAGRAIQHRRGRRGRGAV